MLPERFPSPYEHETTTEPCHGLAITYRVERHLPTTEWVDCEVAFRSPYGALMFGRSLGCEFRIVDDFSPPGRRVTPTVFTTELSQRVGYEPKVVWPVEPPDENRAGHTVCFC